MLGAPRSSSVFPAPVRPVLAARSYAQACAVGARVDGRRLSLQTWGIVPKIAEVDKLLRAERRLRRLAHEVHPELSFLAWAGHATVVHGKKTAEGRSARERVVRRLWKRELEAALAALPRPGWAMDDLLDAFAALWTAQRIAAGIAGFIPREPPKDRFGLQMEITF